MLPRRFVPLACLLGVSSAVLAGAPTLMRARGWAPLVALTGAPDERQAVTRLEETVETLDTVLHGLEVDGETRRFLDRLRGNLGSYDWEGLYQTLPEQSGPWRRVRIMGQRAGERYQVRRAPEGVPCAVDPASQLGDALGDLAIELRTRPAPTGDRGNYVAHLQAGLGVGPVAWDHLLGALQEGGRLLASGDPNAPDRIREAARRPSAETRLWVLERNPGLGPEDIEVVGVLREAFPRTTDVLADLACVRDVAVWDPKGSGDYQQLRLEAGFTPERLEAKYPALADFFAKLGPILKGDVRFADHRGRYLGRFRIDTEALTVTLEGFVRDGALAPVGGDGRVVTTPDAIPSGHPRFVNGVADLAFNVNGVEVRLRQLKLRTTYLKRPDGADLLTTVREVPEVSVSGRAFGLLPTWAIDVVIPGNMDELTREFLTAATAGNGGRGIQLAVHARSAGASGPGTVAIQGDAEVLNSTLISLAFEIASEKLLKKDAVRAQLWDLFRDLHGAFAADLGAFAEQVR